MTDKIIVLGGTGFIGRNTVQYLVESGVASKIRVVDKVLPQTAFLGGKHQEAFANPVVEFMQGNLNSAASIEKCFANSEPFDFCFHLAAETRYSQSDDVYKEKIVDVATKCAKQALASGVKYFVYLSTAQVYDAGKKPSDENSKLKPWTNQAKFMLEAEGELSNILGDKLNAFFGSNQGFEPGPFRFQFLFNRLFLTLRHLFKLRVNSRPLFFLKVEFGESGLVINRNGGFILNRMVNIVNVNVISKDRRSIPVGFFYGRGRKSYERGVGKRIPHVPGKAIDKVVLAPVSFIRYDHYVSSFRKQGVTVALLFRQKLLNGGKDNATACYV